MAEQLTLDSALRARDDAIERVDANADPDWRDVALEAVRLCALANETFTIDDVWPLIPDGAQTHEKRAAGAVVRRAVNNDWIEGTDEYRPSSQPKCHGNPRRVWRSKLWQG